MSLHISSDELQACPACGKLAQLYPDRAPICLSCKRSTEEAKYRRHDLTVKVRRGDNAPYNFDCGPVGRGGCKPAAL